MLKILLLFISVINIYAFDALVSASDLKKSFDDEKLVIIDVSDAYQISHIKNAISFNPKYLINKLKSYNALKSSKRLKEIFANIGLENDSKIVIYGRNSFDGIKKSSFLAFALSSVGFQNISILDGGYMSMVFEDDKLISSELVKRAYKGKITLPNKDLIVDAKELNTNKFTILDARDRGWYDSKHISGAISSPFSQKFNIDFSMVDIKKLQDFYLKKLKVGLKEIVVYSDDIFSSSVEWFILNRIMGFSDAKIYYNSFVEYQDLGLEVSQRLQRR